MRSYKEDARWLEVRECWEWLFGMLHLDRWNKGVLHHTVAPGSRPSIAFCCCDGPILQKPHQLPHRIMYHDLRIAFNENVELWVLGCAGLLARCVE